MNTTNPQRQESIEMKKYENINNMYLYLAWNKGLRNQTLSRTIGAWYYGNMFVGRDKARQAGRQPTTHFLHQIIIAYHHRSNTSRGGIWLWNAELNLSLLVQKLMAFACFCCAFVEANSCLWESLSLRFSHWTPLDVDPSTRHQKQNHCKQHQQRTTMTVPEEGPSGDGNGTPTKTVHRTHHGNHRKKNAGSHHAIEKLHVLELHLK